MTSKNLDVSLPFSIGSLQCPNRLIQGPLAGVSAAPFRRLFYQYASPAYAVTEMISAQDVLTKHAADSRYLFRAPEEKILSYQLAGSEPMVMAQAAFYLQQLGADIIDINCGCPKSKIRKKGAGSALMDMPEHLLSIVRQVRDRINVPLTVKLRIYGTEQDLSLAEQLEAAGVDALIIHGRKWTDDYTTACNFSQIALIKRTVSIPVIANGDIFDEASLDDAIRQCHTDAYMISRAGCGRPWLFQQLLEKTPSSFCFQVCLDVFNEHIDHLCALESEYQAVIQSRTLVRYYFRHWLNSSAFNIFYTLHTRTEINDFLSQYL